MDRDLDSDRVFTDQALASLNSTAHEPSSSAAISTRGEQLGHQRTGHAGCQIRRVVADQEQRSVGLDRGNQAGKQPVHDSGSCMNGTETKPKEPARAGWPEGLPAVTRCVRMLPDWCSTANRISRPAWSRLYRTGFEPKSRLVLSGQLLPDP
jgi:hypothetical protein